MGGTVSEASKAAAAIPPDWMVQFFEMRFQDGAKLGLVTSSSHTPQTFLSQPPNAFGAAMVVH